MVAASSGAAPHDVGGLLRALRPVLVPEAVEQPAARVSLVGRGQTVERIAGTLTLAGVSVSISEAVPASGSVPATGLGTTHPTDLGIAVGHYVLDPESYGFWLRRDLPHLPVVFGDDSVQIGPIVEPGKTGCLYCVEHHRRDADPSWQAIASQLWGKRAESETPLVSAEVAAKVARLVLGRLELGRQPARVAARSFRLAVGSGELTRRDWMPHPECGCVAIPAAASAGRPETDSAPGSGQPTTAAVSAWPA
jgi:bacteriocin biosynthesis cyclodehydratase domain-containing protein